MTWPKYRLQFFALAKKEALSGCYPAAKTMIQFDELRAPVLRGHHPLASLLRDQIGGNSLHVMRTQLA